MNEFGAAIKRQLESLYGDSRSIWLGDVKELNQVTEKGLFVEETESGFLAGIYLEPYFEQYQKGKTIEEAASDIYGLLQLGIPEAGILERFRSFDRIKGLVTFSLINAGRNQKLLENLPHIKALDLAVIFHIETTESGMYHIKAMVTEAARRLWKTTAGELLALAMENTPRQHPASIKTKEEAIRSMLEEWEGNPAAQEVIEAVCSAKTVLPLYILSNDSGRDGAAAMMYEGVLKDFADRMDRDLLLIPTSIHEAMVVLYDGVSDGAKFWRMVRSINRTETPPESVLSDNIYYYKRLDNSLMTASGREPGQKLFLDCIRDMGNMDRMD